MITNLYCNVSLANRSIQTYDYKDELNNLLTKVIVCNNTDAYISADTRELVDIKIYELNDKFKIANKNRIIKIIINMPYEEDINLENSTEVCGLFIAPSNAITIDINYENNYDPSSIIYKEYLSRIILIKSSINYIRYILDFNSKEDRILRAGSDIIFEYLMINNHGIQWTRPELLSDIVKNCQKV